MSRREWTDAAACKGMNLDLFFTPVAQCGPRKWAAEVRAACYSCAVQIECLNWAFENEDHGFWGGMDPEDRRKARNRAGVRLEDAPTALKHYV